jgi:hypothetical protein
VLGGACSWRVLMADNALDDEDKDALFAHNYAADFPEALNIMTKAILQGRPVNNTLGPVQQIKVLAKSSEYRAATPRRPGKGKVLPQNEAEGEQEFESRKAAQKNCQRLIVPKPKSEKSDAFIRRLDAHRTMPEALIAPMSTDETEIQFAKRCAAIKQNENPNQLILPKTAKETDTDFEERLEKAKKVAVLIFPRGVHETSVNWKARAAVAVKSKLPIMPKGADENEAKFKERVDLQPKVEHVIHPFDPAREDDKGYSRRLQACKERTGRPFEPGDAKAINAVLGAPPKHEEVHLENAVHIEHHDAAELLSQKMQSLENIHHQEEESAAQLEAKDQEAKEEAMTEEMVQEKIEEKIKVRAQLQAAPAARACLPAPLTAPPRRSSPPTAYMLALLLCSSALPPPRDACRNSRSSKRKLPRRPNRQRRASLWRRLPSTRLGSCR